jgi:hypothetical protein
MPFAEFEEKTYEQHLNFELLAKRPFFVPPGQSLEHAIGFDVALFTRSRAFWRNFNSTPFAFPWWRKGITVDPGWWPELDQQINYFPRFRCNLFIQHKRPEYVSSIRASEWNDWSRPYFRYFIDAHQQRVLGNIVNNAADLALAVYASPAFHTYEDLWDHSIHCALIDNSNFAEIARLNNHARYTYADPGRQGLAFSEPDNIESVDFLSRLDELAASRKSDLDNLEFLIRTGELVNSVLSKDEKFADLYAQMTEFGIFLELKGAATTFLRMSAFTYFTNSVWMIRTT